jgi:hypothetical protein
MNVYYGSKIKRLSKQSAVRSTSFILARSRQRWCYGKWLRKTILFGNDINLMIEVKLTLTVNHIKTAYPFHKEFRPYHHPFWYLGSG